MSVTLLTHCDLVEVSRQQVIDINREWSPKSHAEPAFYAFNECMYIVYIWKRLTCGFFPSPELGIFNERLQMSQIMDESTYWSSHNWGVDCRSQEISLSQQSCLPYINQYKSEPCHQHLQSGRICSPRHSPSGEWPGSRIRSKLEGSWAHILRSAMRNNKAAR